MTRPKYKCWTCGKEFDKPAKDYNPLPCGDTYCYETYDVCPYCGSNDFEEQRDESEDEE